MALIPLKQINGDPIDGGSGAATSQTQRVVIATDQLTSAIATASNQTTTNTAIGAVTETSPSTDTASSGLNGRLQRIAQRLTSLISLLPTSLGAKTKAASLSVAPSTDAIFNGSLPTVTSGTILSLTTNATGTTYTAFSSTTCTALDLVNNTGVTIEYRRGASGSAMQIPDKSARLIIGITNANQIDVRRTDVSNTTVSLQAEAFIL